MPINDCPFTIGQNGFGRPILPITILNPHTGKHHRTIGIVDTGADECAIPAWVAAVLGHDLQSGQPKNISTGNGVSTAYSHTTSFDVFHPSTGDLLYNIPDAPIDFMPNLNVVLLGVNSFLSRFILNVNYPEQKFSINYP